MATCPNCGVEIPRDSTRIGSEVVHAFLEGIGGAAKLGQGIAEDWENLEGHSKVLMHGKALQLIENEDKARARQQEIEYLGQQQERAILLEHSLYLLENDEAFRTKLIEVARKRELLAEPEMRLLDVE